LATDYTGLPYEITATPISRGEHWFINRRERRDR